MREKRQKSITSCTKTEAEKRGNIFSLQYRNAVALPGWPKAK